MRNTCLTGGGGSGIPRILFNFEQKPLVESSWRRSSSGDVAKEITNWAVSSADINLDKIGGRDCNVLVLSSSKGRPSASSCGRPSSFIRVKPSNSETNPSSENISSAGVGAAAGVGGINSVVKVTHHGGSKAHSSTVSCHILAKTPGSWIIDTSSCISMEASALIAHIALNG